MCSDVFHAHYPMFMTSEHVPRLSMTLILLHHLPVFFLTSFVDIAFRGNISWAGWFNIGTSMIALANTLAITKCGETFCGEGYCGIGRKGADDEEVVSGTLAATECGETNYKAMEL